MTFRKFLFSVHFTEPGYAITGSIAEPYPSTYSRLPSNPVLIVNATILTGTGERIENGSLLIADGRIKQMGQGSLKHRMPK